MIRISRCPVLPTAPSRVASGAMTNLADEEMIEMEVHGATIDLNDTSTAQLISHSDDEDVEAKGETVIVDRAEHRGRWWFFYPAPHEPGYGPPHLSLFRLFVIFLGMGIRGFGGPVAQISLMKQQFVEEGRWMSVALFNRVYAFYQVIPGPEATEIAIYFGYQCRGFIGGLLSGLGFILPGFCLLLFFSWLYVTVGFENPVAQASFKAVQPAVTAMIFAAVRKLSEHSFADREHRFSVWLAFLGLLGLIFTVLRINFLITLAYAGALNVAYSFRSRRWVVVLMALSGVVAIVTYALVVYFTGPLGRFTISPDIDATPTAGSLFLLAMVGGMLTFGGAYTTIPFIQEDIVNVGGWLTNDQFLDGLAITNLLPTPTVMFVTFVGFVALRWGGAILMTIGMFLPAFTFSLVFHHVFNWLLNNRVLMPIFEGFAATVIGMVLVTACGFLRDSVEDPVQACIFMLAIFALTTYKGPLVQPALIISAAFCGQALYTTS